MSDILGLPAAVKIQLLPIFTLELMVGGIRDRIGAALHFPRKRHGQKWEDDEQAATKQDRS